MEQNTIEAANITFKRALSRNEATEEVCSFWIVDFDRVEFFSDGVKRRSLSESVEFVQDSLRHFTSFS
jgi:hypothetical protein